MPVIYADALGELAQADILAALTDEREDVGKRKRAGWSNDVARSIIGQMR